MRTGEVVRILAEEPVQERTAAAAKPCDIEHSAYVLASAVLSSAACAASWTGSSQCVGRGHASNSATDNH